MLVYNVTTKIDWSIAEEWVRWMQDVHIPEVIGTGCFERHLFVKLLEVDEEEGPTYAVQYFAKNRDGYDRYIKQHAPSFREAIMETWGSRFIAFRSLMEVVD